MTHDVSSHARSLLNRRNFLGQSATGLGAIALTSLLSKHGLLADQPAINPARPHAARPPHFPANAKNVLVIFCAGACSQLETWDYKPELIKHDGKPLKNGPPVTFQGPAGNLARPQYKFRPYGQTGKMCSDMVPHLASMADDYAFIHSLTSKSNTHGPAENFISTGFTLDGFPSMGAWITYALGSENENLPAFVAIPDPRGIPQSSVNNWGAGFLPAVFQGTAFNSKQPIQNLQPPKSIANKTDVAARDLLKLLNDQHLKRNPEDTNLSARIASYELAARMQLSVPEISDLSTEPQHILKMYGADDTKNKIKADYAKNCILARRLIEKGVRVVQLFNGSDPSGGNGITNWDSHANIKNTHAMQAEIMDQPTAALLRDLKRRGLLDHTLVVWATEFGRMPFLQGNGTGRDHNPGAFTCFMAGAGVKTGMSYGASDEFGFKAVHNRTSVYDFNATILHLMGLDHERLSYYHNGLERRLTNVHGHVVKEVLA